MEVNESVIYAQNSTGIFINILQTFFFIIFAYYTNYKICNKKIIINLSFIVKNFFIVLITLLYLSIKTEVSYFIGIISLTLMSALIFSTDNFGHSIISTIIALGINYVLSIITIIICFLINKILEINNDTIYFVMIIILHLIMLAVIFKNKKLKYGIGFLARNQNNENIDVLILNISAIVLLSIIAIIEISAKAGQMISVLVVIFPIIMIVTTKKSLQLYYKQKLFEKELNETKAKLEEKEKEVKELEAENLKISKNSHTLSHKQKSLEYKIEQMMSRAEISTEEAAEVRNRVKEIKKDLYKEKSTIKLDKTGIALIDDMLEYMQSECKKNKIEFELQIKGNIHYMTNNLITKEDLETLLADHIKNAIIAINHTENVNRSILVRLGEIDGIYSLYIYDSGIEFTKETLENLGKKPSTTHAGEGGTGMGFMNTFDTLRKCEASLMINELNELSKENYTKAIIIKFDKKNEFKIISYR